MSGEQHSPGPRRAWRGAEKAEWEIPGCGFVLGPDGKTVVGRFPRHEDAILDAAAPDLLTAAKRALAIFKSQGESVRPHNVLGALDHAIRKATGELDR